MWLGSFPIVINKWAALSITVYYAATLGLQYYTRTLAHLKSMWFSSVGGWGVGGGRGPGSSRGSVQRGALGGRLQGCTRDQRQLFCTNTS